MEQKVRRKGKRGKFRRIRKRKKKNDRDAEGKSLLGFVCVYVNPVFQPNMS